MLSPRYYPFATSNYLRFYFFHLQEPRDMLSMTQDYRLINLFLDNISLIHQVPSSFHTISSYI